MHQDDTPFIMDSSKINVGCCAADINSVAHAQDHIPGSSPDYEIWNPGLACCGKVNWEGNLEEMRTGRGR